MLFFIHSGKKIWLGYNYSGTPTGDTLVINLIRRAIIWIAIACVLLEIVLFTRWTLIIWGFLGGVVMFACGIGISIGNFNQLPEAPSPQTGAVLFFSGIVLAAMAVRLASRDDRSVSDIQSEAFLLFVS